MDQLNLLREWCLHWGCPLAKKMNIDKIKKNLVPHAFSQEPLFNQITEQSVLRLVSGGVALKEARNINVSNELNFLAYLPLYRKYSIPLKQSDLLPLSLALSIDRFSSAKKFFYDKTLSRDVILSAASLIHGKNMSFRSDKSYIVFRGKRIETTNPATFKKVIDELENFSEYNKLSSLYKNYSLLCDTHFFNDANGRLARSWLLSNIDCTIGISYLYRIHNNPAYLKSVYKNGQLELYLDRSISWGKSALHEIWNVYKEHKYQVLNEHQSVCLQHGLNYHQEKIFGVALAPSQPGTISALDQIEVIRNIEYIRLRTKIMKILGAKV